MAKQNATVPAPVDTNPVENKSYRIVGLHPNIRLVRIPGFNRDYDLQALSPGEVSELLAGNWEHIEAVDPA